MKIRFGILDVAAAGLTLFVFALPAVSRPVRPLYGAREPELSLRIAQAQADVIVRPQSGAAAGELVAAVIEAEQTDWGLRAGGAAAARITGGDRWRAVLATSVAHGARLEVKPAYEWAAQAVTACNDVGPPDCPPHERARLDLYAAAMKAGLDSKIDPWLEPHAFEEAIRNAVPTIRVQPPKPPKP